MIQYDIHINPPCSFSSTLIYYDVIMELYKLLYCNTYIVYIIQLYCMCCMHSCFKAHSTLVKPSDRTVALLAHSINFKLSCT